MRWCRWGEGRRTRVQDPAHTLQATRPRHTPGRLLSLLRLLRPLRLLRLLRRLPLLGLLGLLRLLRLLKPAVTSSHDPGSERPA